MYNLMCSLIVLVQYLQLNHSCVFIVVFKVGNRVTIQLASYAKKSNTKIVDNFKIFSKHLNLNYISDSQKKKKKKTIDLV